MSLFVGIFHFVDFGEGLVDVGVVGVDGFFPDGGGIVMDNEGSIAVIGEWIEGAKGLGCFDFVGLFGDIWFALGGVLGQFL